MVYESIDHENHVTCHAVPIVLFLVFREKKNVIVKKNKTKKKQTNRPQFSMCTLL